MRLKGSSAAHDQTAHALIDRGHKVLFMRTGALVQLAAVGTARPAAADGEPKGIVRDREVNRCIRLPVIGRELYEKGLPRQALGEHFKEPFTVTSERFIFQAGQPAEVRRAYEEATGCRLREEGLVRSS